MSVDTHLLYIVHGPVMAALLVRIFVINHSLIILEMLLMCREYKFLYFKSSDENLKAICDFSLLKKGSQYFS